MQDHTYVNGNATPWVSFASSGSVGSTSSASGASTNAVRRSPVSKFGRIGELDTSTVTIWSLKNARGLTRRELRSLHLYTALGSSVLGGMYSDRVVNVRTWTSKWCRL